VISRKAENSSKFMAATLEPKASEMIKEAQDSGRPRDLAEERWILEVADIYENAFSQPARANWAKFRRLLELSRPPAFPLYGKLNPRQIGRTLKLRRKPNRAIGSRGTVQRAKRDTGVQAELEPSIFATKSIETPNA